MTFFLYLIYADGQKAYDVLGIKQFGSSDWAVNNKQLNFNIRAYRFFIFGINYGGVYGNTAIMPIFSNTSKITGSVSSTMAGVVTASFSLDVSNNSGTLNVSGNYFGNGEGVYWGFI